MRKNSGHLRRGPKRSGLEVNTTRPRLRALSVSGARGPELVADEGGRAISFGSDAHSPEALAAGFEFAREIAAAAGFSRRPTLPASGFVDALIAFVLSHRAERSRSRQGIGA
jgi:hypothetical protein